MTMSQHRAKVAEILAVSNRCAADAESPVAANEPQSPFSDGGFFTVEELKAEPPPQRWIWNRTLPDEPGFAGSYSGIGGGGKTSFVVGLMAARAQGKPFLGRDTRKGLTVFVSAEETKENCLRKLKAWAYVDPDFDYDEVVRGIFFIPTVGKHFRLATKDHNSYEVNDATVDEFAKYIREKAPGADFIILETTNRLTPDESNEGLGVLISACESLGRKTGAFVLVIGHVSKDAGRNSIGDAYAARGGGALSDNGRATLTLTRFPQDEKTQKKLWGKTFPPALARELFVFASPKVNGAPPQDPVILSRVGTKYAMTFEPFDIKSSVPWDGARLAENEELLTELHRVLAGEKEKGKRYTVNAVKGLAKATGIAKTRIKEVVDLGIAMGTFKWSADKQPHSTARFIEVGETEHRSERATHAAQSLTPNPRKGSPA
jgi:RecA-family ATPase